jgi:uncharacterized protein
MDGLSFQTATPPVRSDPARADIACFVGFVANRQRGDRQRARMERALADLGWSGPPLPPGARVLPDHVLPSGDSPGAFAGWLYSRGWRPSPNATAGVDLFRQTAAALLGDALVGWWVDYAWLSPIAGRRAADLLELADVPVPIDSWDAFDALFAWNERPLLEGTSRRADTALGAAVRRFFLQGGRKCYVVRTGDPWTPFTDLDTRANLRPRILATDRRPVPVDRSTWAGVAHLFGLPEVSFLCTPDVPDLFAMDAAPIAPDTAGEGDERFVECSTRSIPSSFRSLRAFPAARCDDEGFRGWSAFVSRIGRLLERDCREVQFVASVPLPVDERLLLTDPAIVALSPSSRRRAIAQRIFSSRRAQRQFAGSIQTAFVQLAYPWLETRESVRLPGALEAPDAMLAGLLANNALTRGTWRSLAREPVPVVIDVEPLLSRAELDGDLPYQGVTGAQRIQRSMRDRISIFGPSATGLQLLSDVTTDDDEAYRPANVNRLIASIVRAARLIGEDLVFTNSGESGWRRLQSGLEALLLGLWGDGALEGATSSEAFAVRCSRATMTQADLDAGRVIARIELAVARPIERITVVLAMDEGGHVSLVSAQGAAEVPA